MKVIDPWLSAVQNVPWRTHLEWRQNACCVVYYDKFYRLVSLRTCATRFPLWTYSYDTSRYAWRMAETDPLYERVHWRYAPNCGFELKDRDDIKAAYDWLRSIGKL